MNELVEVDRAIRSASYAGNASLVPPPSKLDVALAENPAKGQTEVRSTRLDPRPNTQCGLGVRMSAKVAELLELMQVPVGPMPTERVCDAHDALKRDVLKLMALKRQVSKLKIQGMAFGPAFESTISPPSVPPSPVLVPMRTPPPATTTTSLSRANSLSKMMNDVAVDLLSSTPPPPSISVASNTSTSRKRVKN